MSEAQTIKKEFMQLNDECIMEELLICTAYILNLPDLRKKAVARITQHFEKMDHLTVRLKEIE